jgi:hypothetical protein
MAISARINWGVSESTNLKNRKEILVALRLSITGITRILATYGDIILPPDLVLQGTEVKIFAVVE